MHWSFHSVRLSIITASLATLLALFFAFLALYMVVYRKMMGKAFIELIFFLPLVLPPTVIGFLLLTMFGKNSWLGIVFFRLTGKGIFFTPLAAILVACIVAFPLMYQSFKTGFLSIDPDILGAAKVDGATERSLFIYMIVPLCYRSIITGILLGFARGLGEFGATLMFVGNIPGKTQTIPTAIYMAIETGNLSYATYYAFISIGISFLLLWGANQFKGNSNM